MEYVAICHAQKKQDAFILYVIAFLQAAWRDRWSGHAIGQYKVVRNHPEDVIAMLTKAGHSFCELI